MDCFGVSGVSVLEMLNLDVYMFIDSSDFKTSSIHFSFFGNSLRTQNQSKSLLNGFQKKTENSY